MVKSALALAGCSKVPAWRGATGSKAHAQAPASFGSIHPAKQLEPHMRNADGAPLYLLDIALPLRDDAGEIKGVVGSHFNWKMIEEVLRHCT